MKKTGLEIVEIMAKRGKGAMPKKIKWNGDIWEHNRFNNNYECNGETLNMFNLLNHEFEIIEDEPKVWKPSDDEYWFIDDGVHILRDFWDDSNVDIVRYEIGNCFRIEEEAEKALEKIKIYVRLKRYAEEHNEEKIDWENEKQNKWTIYFQCGDLEITQDWSIREMAGVYFTSRELCKQAIEEIGEENIKKLFEEKYNGK